MGVRSPRNWKGAMAQLLVRNLDPAVKEALRRRAERHRRSMEEEARVILRRAVESDDRPPRSVGLGSRIAALFADAGLDQPLAEPPPPLA
ncbi:MAG: plasmid stabilization protein [Synechococcaceae cyanobacterium]